MWCPRMTHDDTASVTNASRRRRGTGSIYYDGTSWIACIKLRDGNKVRRRAVTEQAAENRLADLLAEHHKAGNLGYGYQPPGTLGLMWMWQTPEKKRARAGVTRRVRFQIFQRDGFRCVYCGATARTSQLHIDHVVPVSKGGTDQPSNLATACADCNLGKADLSTEDERNA